MIFDERDVLLKAAGIVEEMWCQDLTFVYDPQGDKIIGVCAMGAITLAGQALGVDESMHNKADRLLGQHIATNSGIAGCAASIVTWNDTPGRTAHEVASAMREAASGNLG